MMHPGLPNPALPSIAQALLGSSSPGFYGLASGSADQPTNTQCSSGRAPSGAQGSVLAASCKDKLIGNLKGRREALGWSVKEVGDRTGLGENVIQQWERGGASPQLEAVASWASALGLALALTPAEDEARRRLHVDWAGRRISVEATPVHLTPMEWKALERLAAAPGELVPHIDLFRHLYGEHEPYRAQSTAIRVLITKLRRLLPPLRIEAQWGRGYVISGIASSSPRRAPQTEVAAERPVEPVSPRPDKRPNSAAPAPIGLMLDRTVIRPKLIEISHPGARRATATPARPSGCRAEEMMTIERFLAERGVTRCPDVATLPTLVWDKKKRRWVRPPTVAG
jgi:transcriptional regulator with XRE-family HTH domain